MAKLTLILSFVITLFIIFPKSSPAPTYIVSDCPNTTMFVTKSPYQTNLNTVFYYLSSNATSPFGFHEALAGNGTNGMVYGNFLCRGDHSPDSCQDYVTTATTTDLPKTYCPNRNIATIWYDQCMVRYSNESFFGKMDEGGYLLYNAQNITGNISQFVDIVNDKMNDIVTTAANGGPNKKYATGVAQYNSSLTIYGLEQCTPGGDY
ncbi:cysteine-rich receptor-like protein kinase 25 [Silene latifolia]|uniref:cysteine-rich receptor-like protein kinase 25 n=1 Tax=Silene latifolia TaxID=37657 RepID=UPI003D77BAED